MVKCCVQKTQPPGKRKADSGGKHMFALCFAGENNKISLPCVVYGDKGDGASQAAGLFEALRQLDAQGAEVVLARSPAKDGVGLAVRNRLLRAAGFREIVL